MKTKTIIAVTTLIASSALAQAADKGADKKTHQQENIHSEQDQAAPAENLRMGMPMMAMHEHMKKMQVQMDEVHHSKDPDKRDELLDEHRSSMHNMMKMMQGMQAGQSMNRPCDMMGKGMGKQGMSGGGMMGDQQGDNISMPQGGMMGMPMMEMMHRQRMMGQRMDMMQMMMDQMMQNQMATEETRMMRKRGMGMSK